MANIDTIKRRYGIVGRSPALENALNTAVRVAPSDLSVLIMGESGVGKEVMSRIIHDNSPRKHQGFIAINCGALPEGTINSELFGHVKGAYTSSTGDRKGYFETLDGGTIFLDEVGEMPAQTQTFLLRVLENGEFIRMGSNKVQKTDVRVVAATNRKLLDRVRDGKFREDLYYEKQGIEAVQLEEEARWLLEQYAWPGNIRELKNVAERMSILSEKRELSAVDLAELMPQLMQRNLPAIRTEDQVGNPTNNFQERDILYKVLFDMKEDMTQLKNLIADLIRSNNLSVRDVERVQSLAMPGNYPAAAAEIDRFAADAGNVATEAYDMRNLDVDVAPMVSGGAAYAGAGNRSRPRPNQPEYKPGDPIIVDHNMHRAYAESEVVDEDLSLANAEKELIKKALRKHNGRRKEAAAELGISERTLYRKIKEYEVVE